MRFKIDVNELRSSSGMTRSVADGAHTIPILQNTLVEAGADEVSFRATNLNFELLAKVKTVPEHVGTTTVSAKLLNEVARKLPNGSLAELTLNAKGDKLVIVAGHSRFELPTLPKEDFPAMAFEDFTSTFTAESGVIRRLFDKSKVAISTDQTRKYLNGLYFHVCESPVHGKSLCCAATDGYQLAKIEAEVPDGAEDLDGVIVPEKTVQEVVKILDRSDARVEVSVSETKFRIATPLLTFTSRVVEGNFPQYEQLIPDNNPLELNAEATELLKAVQRVSTVSQQETRAVELTIEDGRMSMAVNEPGYGMAEDEVMVEFHHPVHKVKYVHRHLLNIVAQLATGRITFHFQSDIGPTIIEGDSDPRALFVVMPVRV